MKNNNLLKTTATLLASLSMFACGGGDSSDDSKSASSNTVEYGLFSDSKVINLSYRTDSQQGFTDENGYFKYKEGEQIVFSIGNITLPPVYAEKIITPLELVGTANIDNQSVLNILRLLQTLDTDKNPENGISIDPNAHGIAQAIDFSLSSEAFELAVADLLMDLSIDGGLVSAGSASSHFLNTLNDIAGNRSSIVAALDSFAGTSSNTGTVTQQTVPSLLGKVVYARDQYGETCYNFSNDSKVSIAIHDFDSDSDFKFAKYDWYQDGSTVVFGSDYETWVVVNVVENIWRVSRTAIDQETMLQDVYVANSFSEIANQLNVDTYACLSQF